MTDRWTITPIAPEYAAKKTQELEEKMRELAEQDPSSGVFMVSGSLPKGVPLTASSDAPPPPKSRRPKKPNPGRSRARKRQRRRKSFNKHEISPDVPRGLFTLFIEDGKGQGVAQVWASTPKSAASLMAPWAKDRLRRARKHAEVPVELVGWDHSPSPAALSIRTDIPEEDLDPGLTYGTELTHVWLAEREMETEDESGRIAKKTWSLYVIETIPYDFGLVDEEWR